MSEEQHAASHDGDHHDGDHHDDHGTHHSDYVKIWKYLVVLLVISVLGPELEIKWLTLITAFGIAFVKAGIVVKYFMHLGHAPKYVTYLSATALALMVLFFYAVSPDVRMHEGQRWENLAAKAEVQRGLAEGSGHHDEEGHGDDGHHGDDSHHGDDGHHDEEGHGDDGHGEASDHGAGGHH